MRQADRFVIHTAKEKSSQVEVTLRETLAKAADIKELVPLKP